MLFLLFSLALSVCCAQLTITVHVKSAQMADIVIMGSIPVTGGPAVANADRFFLLGAPNSLGPFATVDASNQWVQPPDMANTGEYVWSGSQDLRSGNGIQNIQSNGALSIGRLVVRYLADLAEGETVDGIIPSVTLPSTTAFTFRTDFGTSGDVRWSVPGGPTIGTWTVEDAIPATMVNFVIRKLSEIDADIVVDGTLPVDVPPPNADMRFYLGRTGADNLFAGDVSSMSQERWTQPPGTITGPYTSTMSQALSQGNQYLNPGAAAGFVIRFAQMLTIGDVYSGTISGVQLSGGYEWGPGLSTGPAFWGLSDSSTGGMRVLVGSWTIEDLSCEPPTAADNHTFCIEAGVQTGLGGATPTGGFYSGPGVTDDGNGMTYTFDPLLAESGEHEIVYNYTDAFGCNKISTGYVSVRQPFVPCQVSRRPQNVTAPFCDYQAWLDSAGFSCSECVFTLAKSWTYCFDHSQVKYGARWTLVNECGVVETLGSATFTVSSDQTCTCGAIPVCTAAAPPSPP